MDNHILSVVCFQRKIIEDNHCYKLTEKYFMNGKSYKKIIFIYCIPLLVIAGISVATNIKNGEDIKHSFLIMLITIIPVIYSLIPLIKDSLLVINRSKDRLTSEFFTDRESDLVHLLSILCSQEHRIEIKGKDEYCGKTWLAMRLCDYINHPKDKSYEELKIKIPYKRAFYFDLQKNNAEKLDNFFSSNIISVKDVIIFDHVENIEKLIDKQNRYHFQMVYIMKKPVETDFSSYYISKFKLEDMEILHSKIRSMYPNLDELTKKEFDKLYELTNGNIGRISGVLSEQRSLNWLKEITCGKKTEYDIELDRIQIELFAGRYKSASEMLEEFNSKYNNDMKNVMDLKYKYLLMLSDCKHLLNSYKDALSILSVIATTDYFAYNHNHEIELHKAHYCKHLWKCDDALNILYSIKDESYSAIVDSLGILAAKYFINDLHVDHTDKSSIEVYKDYYICAENSTLEHSQADTYKLMRHKAIHEYYANSNSTMDELISYINKIIGIYHAENNRLLANAYFIQGEIYRLYKEYDNAIISYTKCLGVTNDNNIIIQVNLMVYYLKVIKKLNINFNILDNKNIIELCENNNYASKLYTRIKCIELNDPNANQIISCFDSRIMPIL